MKLYLWENIDQLTSCYHSGGGLVVVAQDEDHARELIRERGEGRKNYEDDGPCMVVTDADWATVKVFTLAADHEPDVFVFPDAGCC